jgi:hypothetical protein
VAWRKIGRDIGNSFDLIDFLYYGGLGVAFLLGVAATIGRTIVESGSPIALVAFVLVTGGTVVAAVRDVLYRRWSLVSKGLLVCWCLGTAIVLVIDLLR